MKKNGSYREQFDRMMRWYKRIESAYWHKYKPYSEEVTPQEIFLQFTDEIYAFFLNCYHLKDWIKHDNAVNLEARSQVEKFINDNDCLSICADICNSIKHLKIDRRRSNEVTMLQSSLWTSIGTEENFIFVKITILSSQGEQKAFELATDCVKKWEEFIKTNIEAKSITT